MVYRQTFDPVTDLYTLRTLATVNPLIVDVLLKSAVDSLDDQEVCRSLDTTSKHISVTVIIIFRSVMI